MLKIDLLPKTFARARINRLMIIVGVVLLVLCLMYWFHASAVVGKQIAQVQEQISQVKPTADKVDQLTAELNSKQAELKPIADKVKFVEDADKSGEPFWEQYHKIIKYVYGRAQMHDFSITPPNSVRFTVTVHGTTEYARFLLNILRCPHMTLTGFQALSAGRAIPSAKQPEEGEWPTAKGATMTTAAVVPTSRGGGGVPGMGPAGGMAGGMMGPGAGSMMAGPGSMAAGPMAGGPGGEMGGMMGMPGAPGMGGGMGGGRAGSATSSPETQEITLQVEGTLTESISVPAPGGGAAAGGGGMGGMMGGMGGGMPGMGGMGGGMPGSGMMGSPGANPMMGGGPGGGAPPGGGAGGGGEQPPEEGQ
ncbi:MAG: hypothetical protein J7M26_04880 [Armatimonadetes bacterium]|nr:hypothetical protein [Armatimonadota bacterium]